MAIGRSRTRSGAAALVVTALAATALSVLPTRAAPPGPAPGDPELGPLIAGATSYIGGTHVWTDYAYDDRGPNTNVLSGGDATYPADPYPGNTADLIQLQLGTAGGSLRVTTVLETLRDDADAVVGVGLDTDSNGATGAPTVPGGQWTNSQPLGLEHLVVLPTRGAGSLLTWDGTRFVPGTAPAVEVDRARNVVAATVTGLMPGTATWRAVGLAGMADAGGSWLDGAHPIYDLAYVRGEDPATEVVAALREQVPQVGFTPYQDKIQADVLAGRLPPSRAVAFVTFGTTRTEPAQPVAPGLNTFLYHSRLRLPEGVRRDPSLQYNGVYQPYAVYISPNAGPRPPMIVLLHGANQYQNVNPVHFSPTGLVIPGAYDVPAVVIFPNGRDTGWGTPLAEQDALDATDDAVRRLNVDPDRIVLSGISSGGYGTYRLVARYPDRWAGGFSIVGGAEDEGPLENLHNVPFRASNGLLDPLVGPQVWASSSQGLADAGTVDHRIALVHNRSHDGPIAEGNCWYLELLNRPRDRRPARVRYTVVPEAFAVDPAIGLDQRPTGAYWVSGMASRDTARATIDADSLARPGRAQVGGDIMRVDENVTKGADFCGPHPSLRGGNNWNVRGREFAPAARPAENRLVVRLTNLAAATIDVVGAGLSTTSPLTVTITGDGPATLTLKGPWKGGAVVLQRDLSGTHTARIGPDGVASWT